MNKALNASDVFLFIVNAYYRTWMMSRWWYLLPIWRCRNQYKYGYWINNSSYFEVEYLHNLFRWFFVPTNQKLFNFFMFFFFFLSFMEVISKMNIIYSRYSKKESSLMELRESFTHSHNISETFVCWN